ncbi:hypothetical protein FHW69_000655 [Luteibacter sp. Sphag1AF]|uniref:hypothetical protein n=1 Tax=Luteibacter sp. Sphag1AF TaxID=2587031 RepID=UPI001622B8E8|nr:hypothetical protein [Luteibacter sp. Sphag1AF]MBB3226065.1 hypothetical protein [Luteibacter sp. Sphag1AF]
MDHSHDARCITGLLLHHERRGRDVRSDAHELLCHLRVEWLLRTGLPLRLVVPVLPRLSCDAHRGRVLLFLEHLATELVAVYPPGIVLTVCLDSRGPRRKVMRAAATELGLERVRFIDLSGVDVGGEAWGLLMEDVLHESLHLTLHCPEDGGGPVLRIHPAEDVGGVASRHIDAGDDPRCVVTRAS